MTPEELQRLQNLEDIIMRLITADRITFQKKIQIFDGRHIEVGLTTGTKIGTNASQKIAFHGATPVIQANAISAPTGGGSAATDAIDQTSRTAINAIITVLKNKGFTA